MEQRAIFAALLQRALYKDETGRRITDADAGPLFSRDAPEEDETSSGKIYVLQSKSDLPEIAENRTVIHKIGVTTGDVKSASPMHARTRPI